MYGQQGRICTLTVVPETDQERSKSTKYVSVINAPMSKSPPPSSPIRIQFFSYSVIQYLIIYSHALIQVAVTLIVHTLTRINHELIGEWVSCEGVEPHLLRR